LDTEVRELVEINMTELVDHMGVLEQEDGWSGNKVINKYIDLKNVRHIAYKQSNLYTQSNEHFDSLIQNGQSDEHRGANFYKACVTLATAVSAVSSPSINVTRDYVRVEPKAIAAMLDEIQFKWYSKDVFVLADVPEGKVPNHKYNHWVETPMAVRPII
jgi:hypothetical protein